MSQELDTDTEQRLREYLWLNHGHQGQYGDDGEMQCGQCHPVWDYKRAPLAEVIRQAIKANGEVNIAALIAHQKAPSSVSAQAVTGWQPIETAKEDGEIVLVFDEGAMFRALIEKGRWIDIECDQPVDPPPSHWMPMPLPPAGRTQEPSA